MADDLPNSPAEDALEILLDDIQRRRDEVDVAQSQAWVDQLDAVSSSHLSMVYRLRPVVNRRHSMLLTKTDNFTVALRRACDR